MSANIWFVGNVFIDSKNIDGLQIGWFSLSINNYDILMPISSATFSIQKEIEYLGTIETFESDVFLVGNFETSNFSPIEDVGGFLSYGAFFQLAYTFKEYTHLYPYGVPFNLLQDKFIIYKNIGLGDLKFVAELEDVFFKRDVHLGVFDVIGEINIVKKDGHICAFDVFKNIDVFHVSDYPFLNMNFEKWKVFFVEGLKQKECIFVPVFPLGNYILEYTPQEKENFEVGVQNIGESLFHGVNLTYEDYLVQFEAIKAFFNLSLTFDILDNTFGLYRLKENVRNVGGVIVGRIKVALVKKEIETDEYAIVDIETTIYPLLNVSEERNAFVFISETIEVLGEFSTPKDISIKEAPGSLIITYPEYIDKINGFVSPVVEAYLKLEREYTNVGSFVYYVGRFKTYSKITIVKQGVYRNIVFNKFMIFVFEHNPFYSFTVVFLSPYKEFPFSFDLIPADSFRIVDTKMIDIVPTQYFSIDDFKSSLFTLKLLDKSFLVDNGYSSLWLFGDLGGLTGYVDTGNVYSLTEVIRVVHQFLSKTYRFYAYILYTQLKGVIEWSEDTLQEAKNYFLQEEVLKATKFIQSSHIYPYGVWRIVSFNTQNPSNEYIEINEDNFFKYDDVSFVVDITSLTPINTYKKLLRSFVFNLNDYKRIISLENVVKFVDDLKNPEILRLELISSDINKTAVKTYISEWKHFGFDLSKPRLDPINEIYYIKGTEPLSSAKSISIAGSYISSSIFPHLVELILPKDIGTFDFEMSFSFKTQLINIEAETFMCSFSIKEFNISNNIFYVGEYSASFPKDVKGDMFYVCNFKYKEVTSYLGYIQSQYPSTFTLNKGLVDVGGHTDKWSTVWAQLFIPTAADIGTIQVLVYDLIPSEESWLIDMPIEYVYVDDRLPGVQKPIPKKSDAGLPFISLMPMDKDPDDYGGVAGDKKDLCEAVYKQLDYAGFEYNIESDDRLLIGNNVFKIKKDLYGGEITEVASMFVKNRYASDLGTFSNSLIEMLKEQVEAPIDEDYSIEKFALEAEDFNQQISEDYLNEINDKIDELRNAIDTQENVIHENIYSYMKEHPEVAEEMKKYLDDLTTIEETYIWNNNPARRPIDGKLFKKIKVTQELAIKVREVDDV